MSKSYSKEEEDNENKPSNQVKIANFRNFIYIFIVAFFFVVFILLREEKQQYDLIHRPVILTDLKSYNKGSFVHNGDGKLYYDPNKKPEVDLSKPWPRKKQNKDNKPVANSLRGAKENHKNNDLLNPLKLNDLETK